MKKVNPGKNYVIRDSDQFKVSLDKPSEGGKLVGHVQNHMTGVYDRLLWNGDGSFVSVFQPHALDLIEADSWNTTIRDRASRLIRPGIVYRLNCLDIVKLTLLKFGESIQDPVTMRVVSDAGEGKTVGSTTYSCDGQVNNSKDDLLSLKVAYPICSTWQAGDPLFVVVKSKSMPGLECKRAVFVSYDAKDDVVVVSTEYEPGGWLGPLRARKIKFNPRDVRLPDPKGSASRMVGWSNAAKDAFHEKVSRMRQSWPDESLMKTLPQ